MLSIGCSLKLSIYHSCFFPNIAHSHYSRHNLEHNSIACVREEVKPLGFRTLSGMETLQEQGIHLIRVPTIEPILNRQWFIEQIKSIVTRNNHADHTMIGR